MKKKYEFTNETKNINGHILHRIRCINGFTNPNASLRVKKGDLGGWVESENNLSQRVTDDKSWIYDDACAYEYAKVYENAIVYGNAQIYGNVTVHHNARVYGNAIVKDSARLIHDVKVYGNAIVCGSVRLQGDAQVYENAVLMNWMDVGTGNFYGNSLIGIGKRHFFFVDWYDDNPMELEYKNTIIMDNCNQSQGRSQDQYGFITGRYKSK